MEINREQKIDYLDPNNGKNEVLKHLLSEMHQQRRFTASFLSKYTIASCTIFLVFASIMLKGEFSESIDFNKQIMGLNSIAVINLLLALLSTGTIIIINRLSGIEHYQSNLIIKIEDALGVRQVGRYIENSALFPDDSEKWNQERKKILTAPYIVSVIFTTLLAMLSVMLIIT